MHLPLKEYQERTLETLTEYYQNCLRLQNANTAFYDLTQRPYASIDGLPGMPYVCLRLPTGGGKTFVACHAVSVTASELLKTESPIVLWLVPSNAIRDQTLNALKNPNHPYRDAFRSARRNVEILTIGEALYLSLHILNTKTTIIVSTMQAFRVEDTDGRKVYEPSGALMGHFTHLADETLSQVEPDESGKPIYSLANLLCVKRPLVIVDEAHNARTELSFETLARFNPSAIIEFTATPDMEQNPSNVLYTVSAAELQAEDMIKMPIQLETNPEWKRLLATAIAQRNALEVDAEEFRCAQFIDTLSEVRYWVRNLERQPLYSFWLQTLTDKFYPDFVCLLTDGRYLVVEYKGDYLWTAEDAKEKREIGELWEKRSEGKCLFIMPRGPDFEAIRSKLS